MTDPRSDGGQALFGTLAVRAGFLTPELVDAALKEQDRLAGQGTPMLIGQILLRRRLLTDAQFVEILREQERWFGTCRSCTRRILLPEPYRPGAFKCPTCRDDLILTHTGAHAGRSIGRFELIEPVGKGGMGVVYKALDRQLGRVVALKILREGEDASPRDIERFHREASLAGRLRHPNIVTVYEVGEADGERFIAMDFIAGRTLAQVILDERGRSRVLAGLLEKIARAADYAHRQGILHRDLKPANILLDAQGEPMLTDFGLAKSLESATAVTRSGVAVGTSFYMSPEQVRGDRKLDARSDVYALGIILYEMLHGTPPFYGSSILDVYHSILRDDPPPVPGAPHELQTIALKAIEKDPARRYPTAAAFADDVARYLKGEPIEARPPSTLTRVARKLGRHKAIVTAGAAIALCLILAGVLVWRLSSRSAEYRRELAAGDACFERADWIAATKHYERASALHPSDEELQTKLAGCAAKLSEIESARAAVSDRVKRRKEADPLVAEARRLLESIPARAAIEGLDRTSLVKLGLEILSTTDRVLTIAPDHPEGLVVRSRILELMGRDEEALAAVEAALAAEPDLVEARFVHAELCLLRYEREVGWPALAWDGRRHVPGPLPTVGDAALGWKSKALADLDVLRRASRDASHLRLIECILPYAERRYADAIVLLDKYLPHHPTEVTALRMRALCRLYSGDPKGGLADLDAALRLWPVHLDIRENRAMARWQLRDLDGALEDYTIVIDSGLAQFAGALGNRAIVFMALGRLDEALRDLNRFAELDPENPAVYVNRSLAKRALRDVDGAFADLDLAEKIDPRLASVHFNRGLFTANDRKDAAGAIAHFTRAIEIDARHMRSHAERGVCRMKIGKHDEAMQDLTRAIELDPAYAFAYVNRGSLYEYKGEKALALADWKRAIEIDPSWEPKLREAIRKAEGP